MDVNIEKKTIELKFKDSSDNFKVKFEAGEATPTTLVIPASTSGMLNVISKIQMLFPGFIGDLLVNLKSLEEDALKKLENIECDKLSISGVPRKVSKSMVVQIISTIKPREECIVDSDLGKKLFPLPPREKININYSTGITGNDLCKFLGATKFIELAEAELEARDINKFINLWLQGSETTTSFLKVSREDEESWNIHQVLKDIPTIKAGTIQRDVSFT